MKIVTLIENLVYTKGLVVEHGLSLYIETGDKKILFDTGQSGLFIQNANALGIDISAIDTVVLSHGHYDHTGGLYPFLQVNQKAKVYGKSSLFAEHYKGRTEFIGTPYRPEMLKDRFIAIDEITAIQGDLFIVPEIEIVDPAYTNFEKFFVKTDGQFVNDTFTDEIFLVFRTSDSLTVLTACSHRGLSNICKTAERIFKLPVRSLIGGFHLKDCTKDQRIANLSFLKQLHPELVGICHCTGIEQYAEISKEIDSRVFYNYTGYTINLD